MPPKTLQGIALDRVPSTLRSLRAAMRAAGILLLAVATSSVSQLTLAPVWGSIPSSQHHDILVAVTFTFGFLIQAIVFRPGHFLYGLELDSEKRIRDRVRQFLAIWTFSIPAVQQLLLPLSGQLGPVGGPILNGLLSCHAIIIPLGYLLADEHWNIRAMLPDFLGAALSPLLLTPFYAFVLDPRFQVSVDQLLALRPQSVTPIHLQSLLATAYSVIYPTWTALFAAPVVLYTLVSNPHMTIGSVNTSLQPHNWTLVDRQWSNTGYVSILDNSVEQYRVMRCDHSLLGGEWHLTTHRIQKEGWKVHEPVYAVFEMLEAVRLIERKSPIPDSAAQALVIGLGIGTAPKALISHGINTTVVELDPVVHDFATKYFNLPTNHTAILRDAVSWVNETVGAETLRYDYIIHDVFTGGAEPLALFNAEFLANLKALLKPDGIIAINYAGDLTLPLTRLVLNTIRLVFAPSTHHNQTQCKTYRDAPPEKHQDPHESDTKGAAPDFLNMVIFCLNTPSSSGALTFRRPLQADYLDSKSRQYYMLPKPEYEIPFPDTPLSPHIRTDGTDDDNDDNDDIDDSSFPKGGAGSDDQILRLGDEKTYAKQQAESAMRHWHIMRRVVPDQVWELW